jgi:hypothetical protein
MTFTVLCVLVRGHVNFTPEYVVRLRSMARRLLPTHRFVCLTDQGARLPNDVETIAIPSPVSGVFGWWSKLHLFDPALPLSGRLVYFDLDVLLLHSLLDIVNYPAPFALVPDGAPAFKPRDGRQCVKRYNSSVMAWDHGTRPDLFTDWNTFVARRLWGDQDWIGERVSGAAVMPAAWFPRLSAIVDPPSWPNEARVLLCKKPKNVEARQRYTWFDKEWA